MFGCDSSADTNVFHACAFNVAMSAEMLFILVGVMSN